MASWVDPPRGSMNPINKGKYWPGIYCRLFSEPQRKMMNESLENSMNNSTTGMFFFYNYLQSVLFHSWLLLLNLNLSYDVPLKGQWRRLFFYHSELSRTKYKDFEIFLNFGP